MGPPAAAPRCGSACALDGQPPGDAHGLDVDADGKGTVVEPRLYQLIRQPGPITDREFEIEFLDPGVEAFVLHVRLPCRLRIRWADALDRLHCVRH